MTAIELRSKLIKIINSADFNSLQRIDSFVSSEDDFEISEEHKLILDERLREYKQNPDAGKSWDIVKEELSRKYGI